MLIEFNQLGKIYKTKFNAFDVIESARQSVPVWDSTLNKPCTNCGMDGSYSSYGEYTRSLHDIVKGKHVYRKDVRINRVKCNKCGSTHAILPAVIAPRCVYSVFFILHVIAARLVRKRKVEDICLDYEICSATFYRFMDMYRENKAKWLELLGQDEMPDMEFLQDMLDIEKLFPMLEKFYLHTSLCFFESEIMLV